MKKVYNLVVTFKAGDSGSGIVALAETEQEACDNYRKFRQDTVEIRAEEISRENAVKLLGWGPNPMRHQYDVTRVQLSEHPKANKIIAFLEIAEEMHKRAAELFIGQ